MRYKDQRVGIFIDVQNLYHSAKPLYNSRVNYRELIKYLANSRLLIRVLGYVVKSEGLTEGKAEAAKSDVLSHIILLSLI